MTVQSMSYDHPAYLVPIPYSGLSAVGANGVTTKFAAYTAMKIKGTVMGPVIATTAAGSQPLLFSKTGTTTSTTTLTVLTSASSAAITNDLVTEVTLAKGDQFWFTHGTDATCAVAFVAETLLIPGADVTV
jgi:hypothetical protein